MISFKVFISLCLVAVSLSGAPVDAQGGILAGLGYTRCNNVVPNKPSGLTLLPLDGAILAIWPPSTNRACDTDYLVEAFRIDESGAVVRPAAASVHVPGPRATLTGLDNEYQYGVVVTPRNAVGQGNTVFAVVSLKRSGNSNAASSNNNNGSGATAGTIVKVSEWSCQAENSYPVCAAAAAGQCTAMTCSDAAKMGHCDASWMRVTNWESQKVQQHCANECGGCRAAPSLRQSMDTLKPDYCCAFGAGEWFSDETGRPTNGLKA